MLHKLFRSRSGESVGHVLYGLAVAQARTPAFYTTLGVADRIDARFELYTLHVLLLVMGLRDKGEQGAEGAQAAFDAYVSSLDDALRELGVGDVTVGKKMRKLGEAVYGRMNAYEPPLRTGDIDALAEALGRNVFEDEAAPGAPALARYAIASLAAIQAQTFSQAFTAPAWAEVSA
jgi:cytochrome b pre-mRNA-processing protein 3